MNGWNFFRGLRMVAGIAIAVQGIILTDWLLVVAGIIFTVLALLNIGCCAVGACTRPYNSGNIITEETKYEEVV